MTSRCFRLEIKTISVHYHLLLEDCAVYDFSSSSKLDHDALGSRICPEQACGALLYLQKFRGFHMD